MRKMVAVTLHQIIATPGLFALVALIMSPVERSLGGRATFSLFGLIVGGLVAVLAGLVGAYLLPRFARFGYWTWIIPSMFGALLVIFELSRGRNPFLFLLRSPRGEDLPMFLYTNLWCQAALYAVGLRLGHRCAQGTQNQSA